MRARRHDADVPDLRVLVGRLAMTFAATCPGA
jgi:hypothetical protein